MQMSSVAAIAARLGEKGLEPAIELLRLSLYPIHLTKRSGRGVQSASQHTSGAPRKSTLRDLEKSISEKMDPSIDEAIEEVQKSQRRRWDIGDECAQKLKEMLRVAYFVLKERLVQPWPPLLVKLLDEAGELSAYLQPSFIELLTLHFGELIKSPFTTNSSVLFWQKDELRWDVGRILAINPTKIVYKERRSSKTSGPSTCCRTPPLVAAVGLELKTERRAGAVRHPP